MPPTDRDKLLEDMAKMLGTLAGLRRLVGRRFEEHYKPLLPEYELQEVRNLLVRADIAGIRRP